VLGGHHGGDDPSGLRFRVATSLLHGRTDDERWSALRAPDPTELPQVRTALDRLAGVIPGIRALAGGN
jgi:aspartate aminotransferase